MYPLFEKQKYIPSLTQHQQSGMHFPGKLWEVFCLKRTEKWRIIGWLREAKISCIIESLFSINLRLRKSPRLRVTTFEVRTRNNLSEVYLHQAAKQMKSSSSEPVEMSARVSWLQKLRKKLYSLCRCLLVYITQNVFWLRYQLQVFWLGSLSDFHFIWKINRTNITGFMAH